METLRQAFIESGYVVVRQLLSSEEVSTYKSKLIYLSDISEAEYGRTWVCPDGISQNPDFWSLIWYPKILKVIQQIFGDSIRYLQHSDLHVNLAGGGWHRDSAHRSFGVGPDWDETLESYQIARVAIYLSAYQDNSSSLALIPQSHRFESPLSPLEKSLWHLVSRIGRRLGGVLPVDRLFASISDPRLQSWIRTDRSHYFLQPPTQPVLFQPQPGDCVIFDPRLIHSGSSIVGPKYSIFLAYGVDNCHSQNYLRYYLHTRRDLNYQDLDPLLRQQLKAKNLLMELQK